MFMLCVWFVYGLFMVLICPDKSYSKKLGLIMDAKIIVFSSKKNRCFKDVYLMAEEILGMVFSY